jgi:hypothetical protein
VKGFGGLNPFLPKQAGTNLTEHKLITSSNYVNISYFTEVKNSLSMSKGSGVIFGIVSTSWLFLYDKFRQWNYSNSQAIVRATFLITPAYLFFYYDRPFTNFWYRSFVISFLACKNIFYK